MIPRSIVSLLVLFLVTKLIGKKQVSELSLFDYVIGISIGNFSAEMVMNLDVNFFNGIVAIITFGIIAYFVSYITLKSIILRRVIIGTPTILIQNGKIIEKNLKKTLIDINELLEQCRNNGVFDISEIDTAIMEVNGKISILLKKENLPVINKDMNIKGTTGLCATIIIDGNIMEQNLKNMNKTNEWLLKQLKIKGKKVNEILLGTLDNNDKLILFDKNIEEYKNILE